MGWDSSPKSELTFQTFVTIGTIIVSTALALYVPVVLKTKPRLIFCYAALATTPLVKFTLARYLKSQIQMCLYYPVIISRMYGSKAYNSITNELILTETILFIYRSERFKHLEAFSWIFLYLNACQPARGPLVQTLWIFIRQLFVFLDLIFVIFFFSTCEWVMELGGILLDACSYHSQ